MSETPRVSGARKLPTGEARAHQVREMFDRIAGRYELLNTLTSFGLNRLWNRSIVRASGLKPGGRALDLACGTGSVTRALADRAGPSGYVVGVDFSSEMLNAAKTRPLSNGEYRLGDATRIEGIESGAFDSVSIAYGARNIPDLDALFSEMARAARPGGVVTCMEITRPTGRIFSAIFGLWFDKIVPWLGGKVSGDPHAYAYLPESVKEFVAPQDLAVIMERNELQDVTWRRLAGNVITLHRGIRDRGAG